MGKHRSHIEWQYLIQKYYSLDISLEEFCGINRLNPKTFCQHKRAYRQMIEQQEGQTSAFVLAKRDEMDEEDNAVYPPDPSPAITLCADKLQLSLPASTSPQWLGLLLKEVLK